MKIIINQQLTKLFTHETAKFLIKSPFGLVGWWILDRSYPGSDEIGGLFYSGD